EQRLTRLFRRTGTGSRTELAASWMNGTLTGPARSPIRPALSPRTTAERRTRFRASGWVPPAGSSAAPPFR
ncbi:hypothetical protein F3K40_45450, partial [Streptomyces sp. LBUM 1478]|nr:hypothetical protein [Streptomyces sp. LBUM 1478]